MFRAVSMALGSDATVTVGANQKLHQDHRRIDPTSFDPGNILCYDSKKSVRG
jgi:hypothetical protein